MPGPLLRARLADLAAGLGPLPHARLDIERGIDNRGPHYGPADRPKKQGTRLLKAECGSCGYTVRVTLKWVTEAGPPHCPKHGAMAVDLPDEDDEPAENLREAV
jgi:hypothetical protein